jgi:PAS domain-containing protein
MSLIDIDKLLEVIVPDQKSTDKKKQVGLYAGGFKPPTSGHFKVVMKALRDNPDLDELKILIGNKDRDGVTQAQSMLIWDIYKKYLPFKVTLEPVSKPPVKAVYNYAKENPDEDVDWILGAREGNEDDFKDIATRTTAADNYPNLTVRTTITDSGASGTAARNAFKVSQEKLEKLLPKKLDQLEKDEVFKILTRVDESVNEGDTYEKMAAKGKKAGNLKQGTVRKRLNIPKGEKIPLTKIKKEISRIKKMENPSEKNKKYLKALNLAKTLKTTTNVNENTKNCGCGQDPCITYGNLNEGKYDGLVTKLAGYTLNSWKGDFQDKQRKGYFELEVGPRKEFDYPHLDFTYKAQVIFDNNAKYKDSGVAKPFVPEVELKFIINGTELPEKWEEISMDLRNIIRHEISHLMQAGPNVKKGKEMDDDSDSRRELRSGKKPWWKIWRRKLGTPDYYKLEKEIDANLEGLYLKAKKSRQPLGKVIDDYLEFKLKLSPKDREDIKDLWRERAPKINVPVFESKDPKKGTGKKPKGSGRRLYTDEDPKDTVGIKFSTRQDIVDTLNKKSFKAKSHARQSQIINLIHQRVRAALGRTKDPAKKKKLKSGFEYIKKRKEASKKKTQRLKKQKLNEVLDPKTFNFKPLIKSLTKSMENDGLKLKPYPKVQFVHNAESNADDFFGKTAYYMPGMNKIVLYTLGRHPKDIMRSYAHELIHVHQNMEDRLNDVNTTNTSEDDHLENIEREAYETGNISFRKWTDSLIKESKVRRGKKGDPFGINAYARELATLEENTNDYYIYLDMDGVVADFDKRFKDLSGFLPNDFVDKYGKNAFWDLIDEKHKVSFWRGIEVMPGAKKLVDFVSKYPYEMLTAPSVKKQSVIGKSLWIRDKVGTLYPSQPKVTYRAAKEKHNVKSDLTKNDILIDDKKSTIDSWNAKGGTAIFYQNADQVINDLQKLGL